MAATILSAQCTDVRVNQVTPELFKKYPTIEAMAGASQDELAADIRSTVFFNNKARSLIGAAKRFWRTIGQVPRSMEELLKVPGAARKPQTSCSAQPTAFRLASSWTRTSTDSQRLDLTKNNDPVKIEQDS